MKWTRQTAHADLARLGANLDPQARVSILESPRPGTRVGLCILDAVEEVDGEPDYCIHGYVSCIGCSRICYLGNETGKAITDRSQGIYPICMQCAEKRIPEGHRASSHVADHLRADGPHED